MKLGFFANAYRYFDLEYALSSIKKHGYQGVELWAKGYHLLPFDQPAKWLGIKQMVNEKYGLEIYGLSAHLDFVAPERAQRDFEIKKFLSVLEMADTMGIERVHTASGGLYNNLSYQDQERDFIDAMEIIGKRASALGLSVALEAEPEKWLSKPSQLVDLIENKLSYKCFGALADTGHAFGIGTTVEQYLTDLKDHLMLIHLDDVRKADFPHRHMVPGTGDVDFNSVFAKIKELGYDSWISMELNRSNETPDQAAKDAKAYISTLELDWE